MTLLSFPGRSICIVPLNRGTGESFPPLGAWLPGFKLWTDGTGEGVDPRPLLEGVDTELLEALLDPSAPMESRYVNPLSTLFIGLNVGNGIPFRIQPCTALGAKSKCRDAP